MASLRAIREIHVQHTSEGADKVRRELDQQAASNERLAKSSENVATVTETSARRQQSAAGAYDRLRSSMDLTYRAQQQFERGQRTLDRAFEQGIVDARQYARDLEMLRSRQMAVGSANDSMAGGLSRVAALMGRLAPLMGALGVGLGGMGGMAMLSDSSRRMEEAERAARRLEGVLESTGAAAGLSAREIAGFADRIEEQTGRAAEEVMAVAAQLATFTSIGRDEFQRTILVANDMAEVFGGSLQSSLDAVARALDDPIKGFQNLRQRGFALEEQELELVKAFQAVGDTAAAQNVVLQNLEKQVGGASARAFDGLTKAQADATKQAEDAIDAFNRVSGAHEARIQTTRAFGSAMAFAGENMETIVPVAGTLTALVGARLATSFLTSTAASNAFGASLTALTTRAGAASAAMSILGGPVGIGVTTVTAIGAAILMWARNGDEANRSLSEHEGIVAQIRDRYREADEARQQIGRRQLEIDASALTDLSASQSSALGGATEALTNALETQLYQLERSAAPGAKAIFDLAQAYLSGSASAEQFNTELLTLGRTNEDVARILEEIERRGFSFDALSASAAQLEGDLAGTNAQLANATGRLADISDAAVSASNAMASFSANLATIREFDPVFTRQAKVQADLATVTTQHAEAVRNLDAAFAGREDMSEYWRQLAELEAGTRASTDAISGLTDARARLADYESTARISALDGRAAALARENQGYEAQRKALIDAATASGDLLDIADELARLDAARALRIADVNKKFDEQDASARRAAAGQRTATQAGEEAIEALQRQIATFGQSEGAIRANEERTRMLAEARRLAAENDKLFDENGAEAQRIREVADEIGALTDQLKALADADAQAKRVADTIAGLDFQNSLFGMSDTDREIATTLRQLQVSYESMDGQRIAGAVRYRAEQERVQEQLEAQNRFVENVLSTSLDALFDVGKAESWGDAVLGIFADIGRQFQELAKQNLMQALFGQNYTSGQLAAGQRSIAQPGFPAGFGGAPVAANQSAAANGAINVRAVTALNDNLGRSARSALDVARQFDGLNERADSAVLDSFMQASGNWRNLSAADTAWCAAFANAAIAQAGGKGTNSNLASSFMGWGQGTNAPQIGDIVVLKPQSAGTSGHVGFVAGFGDGKVQVFGGNQSNAANTRSFGLDQVRGYRTGVGVTGAGVSGSVSPTQGLPYIDGGYTGYNQTGGIPTPTARPGSTWFGENGKISEFMKSPIGQMGMQAVGAFGTGYSSGSMGGGALSGGLQAFVASGFNPIAGIVGAISGGAGGLFGGRAKRRQEHQQKAQAWEQMAPQWSAFQDEVRTGTGATSGLRASQAAMVDQFGQFVQTGSAAWKNGTNNSSALFAQVSAELGEYFARTNAEFGRAYEAQIASLNAGQGLSGPFISARDEILEAGKTLATFVDDTRVVFGDGSVEAQRAAEASIAQLRALLTGGQELSDIAAAVEQMRGAAAGLHTQLEALGKSAEEAGQIVRDDLTTAMDRLRADFTRGIQDQINDLDGKGYLVDFRNLIEGVQQTMQDAALLGGVDTSLVDTFFAKSAQNLVNQAQLTGDAFDELVRAFPPLSGVVKEFSQAVVTATEAEIRSAIEGYEERLFAAQNVGNEIALFERRAAQDRIEAAKFGPDAILAHEAALAAERANMVRSSIQSSEDRLFAAQNGGNDLVAFERQAARERVEAAKFGTDAVAALEKTLAAERANIVLSGARADLDRALQEHQEAANERIRALRTEASELERTVSRLKDFATQLREFRESLMLDANLSTLAPDARLAEAERQFRDIAARAAAGDEDAQRQLTGASERYLSESRDFWGISENYYKNFEEVRRVIEAQERATQGQLTEAQRQHEAINRQITLEEEALALAQKQYDELVGIRSGVMSLGTAIAALSAAQAAARAAGVNTGAGGAAPVGGGGGAGDTSFGRAVNYLNNNPDVAAGIAAGQTFGLPAGSSIEAIAKAHWDRHGQGEMGIPGRKAYASGGLITGPGTGVSDSINILASNGEYMMRQSTVGRLGVGTMDWINQTGTLPSIQPPAPVFVNDNRNVVAAIDTLTAQNADLSRQVAHLTAMLKGTHDEAQVTRKEQLKAAAKAARVAEEEAA